MYAIRPISNIPQLFARCVKGIALRWFTTYLRDRTQQVQYKSKLSTNICSINVGLPQGSILRLMLFSLYVNDSQSA